LGRQLFQVVILRSAGRVPPVLVPIHAARPVPEWETLMGDAIHAMPPLGVHDVNSALHDARILTQQLVAGGDRNLFQPLRPYEAMMRHDGFDAVQRAQADLRETISTGIEFTRARRVPSPSPR
jgi:2-polyprenyl-6-methoxyphenol hydroxylase-like FAD-dependent oxidoreductase